MGSLQTQAKARNLPRLRGEARMFGKKKVVVKTYNAGWIGRMKMNREMARMVGRGYQVSSTAAMPGHSTRSLLHRRHRARRSPSFPRWIPR